MKYSDRIGNAMPRPTVGDLEKARLSRQIEAGRWAKDHEPTTGDQRNALWEWIEKGGPPPWEKPADAGIPHTYPQSPNQASAI